MSPVAIQKRRGTAAQWTAANPVLAAGEEGLETDTGRTKHGDGTSTWTALPYMNANRFLPAKNLVDQGASPAGGDIDAKTALDSLLLDSLNAGLGIALVPMGFYRLKQTWNPTKQPSGSVLPKLLRGFTLMAGWGKIGYAPSGGGFPNGAAKYFAAADFIWYGDDAGVMFELDTIAGMALMGMSWRGRPTAGAANRAGIGVNISQRNPGLPGSGVHLFDRCAWFDMDEGLRFGDGQVTGAGNCDTTSFRDCSWQSVDICVKLTHQQNLVYNFTGTSAFADCKSILRANAGGYFAIEDLNANACGGTTTDAWMIDIIGGSYLGTHRISRGRLENDCKQLLRMRSRYSDVLIEGLFEAQTNQNTTMVDMTGGQLTMIGGKLATHGASTPFFQLHQDTASGGSPTVNLYSVRFDTDRFLYEEWFGHDTNAYPAVTVRECTDQYGRLIPSFSTRLETGLPVPLRARTTDGTTTVNCTLLNNAAIVRTDNCVAISVGAYRVRATFTAVNSDSSLAVRAVREVDVLHTGTALTMSTPEVIGTDNNPDSLVFALVAATSQKHLYATVRGKASTTIDWRVEFRLIGGLSQVTTAA